MIFNFHIDFDLTKNDPVNDPVNLQMNSLELAVLNLLRQNKNITYDELIGALGKSRKTIQRAISKLKALGIIERIGSDKSGYWKMK